MHNIEKNYIYHVGTPTVNYESIIDNCTNEKRLDLINSLKFFIKHSSINRLNIYPNFETGWLYGPSGYVASFSKDSPFSEEPFRSAYFRIISFTEIIQYPELTAKALSDETKELLRKCIPLESLTPPNLEDDENDGWGPELGVKGSSIGIYSYKANTDETAITRFFVGVNSGLHHSVLTKLWARDYELGKENRLITQKSNAPNPPNLNGLTLTTFDEEFSENSIKERMLRIARENNKRLTAIFIKTLKLPFFKDKLDSSKIIYRHLKVENNNNMKNLIANTELLKKVLEWWPTHAPIYPFTSIPNYENLHVITENKHLIPCKEIQGYPLGQVLSVIYEKLEDKFKSYENENNIRYYNDIESFQPDLECDYNTYRIENNEIIWYSNCACISKNFNNTAYTVIRQLAIPNGFECLNHGLDSTIRPMSWFNKFNNGYPVYFKTILDEQKGYSSIQFDTEMKFFSLLQGPHKNKTLLPKQLITSFKRIIDMKNPQYLNDLYTSGLHKNLSIIMSPVSVYLSPELGYNFNAEDDD